MPTQGTRIIKNCMTGEEIIETYEIPDPTAEEIAAQKQQIINNLTRELEHYYDTVAQRKNYDSRLTCALRAGLTGSPFQQEGITFGVWMDTCNQYGYTVMNACLSGERANIPTGEELIAELPVAPW